MIIQGYDLVGDVHGHADPLHRLLDKLDYAEVDGAFRHPERKMIFVGDFIDRGPQQREVLRIARSMCEAGIASAVIGNHEFNAIGWAAQKNDGKFLRSHSEKNASQHAKFLRQIEEDSADHNHAVTWFRSLPIWLDLPGFRVVHACWHEPSREALMSFLDEAGRFTEEGIQESYRHGSEAHAAVEILLKGPEERLPEGIHFFDKMDIGERRSGCVGGIKTQQPFGRPPSGWMAGKMKYRTRNSRETTDITKASRSFLAIVGSMASPESQRQTQRASILALLNRDI
jgi:hypothetical protein